MRKQVVSPVGKGLPSRRRNNRRNSNLAVNLKNAKVLDLTIPQSLLARGDEGLRVTAIL
jgi:hypothetical protein